MKKCKRCGTPLGEYFEWKFQYGLKKMKIIKCDNCDYKKEMGMVDL